MQFICVRGELQGSGSGVGGITAVQGAESCPTGFVLSKFEELKRK